MLLLWLVPILTHTNFLNVLKQIWYIYVFHQQIYLIFHKNQEITSLQD